MSTQAVDCLQERINKQIDYCRKEFDMTYAEVVGVLEIVKHDIWNETIEESEED